MKLRIVFPTPTLSCDSTGQGDFPSSATIPRLYFLHVVAIPLAIGGLLAVHLAVLVRQKHTEAERDGDLPGREPVAADDDSVVVGLPAVPNQFAVTAVVFFLTLATLSLLAGFLPVHNVAAYGPNDPASTPSLIMPDWFLMWGYGFLKLVPSWMSVDVLGVHFSSEFVGGLLLPGLVFAAVALWPFVDYREEPTHFAADPIERPWQTAVGVAGVAFVLVASLAGMDVIVADIVGSSTDAIKPYLIGLLALVPLVAGGLTYVALGGPGGRDEGGDGTAGVDPGDDPDRPETDDPDRPETDDDAGESGAGDDPDRPESGGRDEPDREGSA